MDNRTGLVHAAAYALPYHVDSEKYHVRSCALALLRWKDKLPESKTDDYDRTVRQHLGVLLDCNIPLTPQQLQEVIDVEYRTKDPKYVPGPERVVASLNNDEDEIAAFVLEWRNYFVEVMSPHHLPKGWDVNLAVKSN